MAGLEEIDALFDPQIVDSIQLKSPVTCKIWNGGNSYETVVLDSLYPFDTLDTLKQSITLLKREMNTICLSTSLLELNKRMEAMRP